MNKWMKKKHLLEAEIAELKRQKSVLVGVVVTLEMQVSKNAEATNENFERLEAKVNSNTEAIHATSRAIKIGNIELDGKAVVEAIQKAALESKKVKGGKLFSKNGKMILDVLTGKLKFKEQRKAS